MCYTAKSTKEVVEDLEEVSEEVVEGEESEDRGRSMSGEISAVISTAEYQSCKFCHSKMESEDGLVVELMSSGRETTLSTFEPVLSWIVDGVSGQNLSVKLLIAPSKMY